MGESKKEWTLDEWIKSKETENKNKKPRRSRRRSKSTPSEKEDPEEDILKSVKPAKSRRRKKESVKIKNPVEDRGDWKRFRHNRERYEGFKIGHYIQTPPTIFTRDGHSVFIGDMYRGASAFLILGGPSVNNLNLDLLKRPGILTMSVNNAVRTFRTNLWICVDNPNHFIKSMWLDPAIMKFVPLSSAEKKIFDNESWREMRLVVGDCPNVFYYRRNEHFIAKQFLFEDTINWGNHTHLCHCGFWRPDPKKSKTKKINVCPQCGSKAFGSRSVFLPALRILFYLGVRNVFMLGCDFKMKHGEQNYHFKQDRSRSSVDGNNSSYKMLTQRFEELKPVFEKYNYHVFNCNPDSNLDVFPKVNFEEAVDAVVDYMPDVENERTEGLYDRETNEKIAKRRESREKK